MSEEEKTFEFVQTDKMAVNVTSIKLPAFVPEMALQWFDQVESHFRLRTITKSLTKYDHVLSSISTDTMKRLGRINFVQTEDPYSELKKKILKTFTIPPLERVGRALDLETSEPKLLCCELLTLLDEDGIPNLRDAVIKELMVRRMPANLQPIARANAKLGLEEFTEVLESIQEGHPLDVTKVSRMVDNPLCWVHKKHKDKARFCAAPKSCKFSKN